MCRGSLCEAGCGVGIGHSVQSAGAPSNRWAAAQEPDECALNPRRQCCRQSSSLTAAAAGGGADPVRIPPLAELCINHRLQRRVYEPEPVRPGALLNTAPAARACSGRVKNEEETLFQELFSIHCLCRRVCNDAEARCVHQRSLQPAWRHFVRWYGTCTKARAQLPNRPR